MEEENKRLREALAGALNMINALTTCFAMDAETPVEKYVIKSAQDFWYLGTEVLKSTG